jgi:predicted nucleotidyltransferase
MGNLKLNKFRAEYRIDIVKKKNRLVWMHVDRETACTYQQTIFQACPDDRIEFALSFFSLRGLVDVDTIVWNNPEIYETPTINTLTYNKDMMNIATNDRAIKIYADINRVCELEDTVVEWYEQKYYENKSEIIDFSFLLDLFEVISIEYSGVDNKVVRIQAKAKHIGNLDSNYFSIGVAIKHEKDIVRNEVKRKGILSEREVDIQLRVGDIFIIYITRAKANKN